MSDIRERAIEAAKQAARSRYGVWMTEDEIAVAVLDAIEPIIAEREWGKAADAINEYRERLRAQVEVLPVPLSLHTADCPGRPGYRGICNCAGEQLVRKSDVLVLLRGEPDD